MFQVFCIVFFIYVFECFFWIDVLCFKFFVFSLFMCSNASFGLMYCVSSFLYSVLCLCVRMLLLD